MLLRRSFEIDYAGDKVPVEEYFQKGRVIYRATIVPDLFLAQAKDAAGSFFRTSIPEGRLRDAEMVGEAIDAFLRKEGKQDQPKRSKLF